MNCLTRRFTVRIFLLISSWGNFNSLLMSSCKIAFVNALDCFSDRLLCVNWDHKDFVHFSRFDSFPVKRKDKECLLHTLEEVKRARIVRQFISHISLITKVIEWRNPVTQSNDANFDVVDSLKAFTRIYIHVTRMDRLFAQELGTMSKNNLRGITLVIRLMWGNDALTVHALLYIKNTILHIYRASLHDAEFSLGINWIKTCFSGIEG